MNFFPGNPLARAPMPGRFAETVGLDDSFDFFPGKNPDLGAGSAGLRCRAGAAGLLCRAAGASQPLAKKKACCSPPPTGGLEFFSWEESRPWRRLGRAPMRPGRLCRAGAAGWRSARPYDRMTV